MNTKKKKVWPHAAALHKTIDDLRIASDMQWNDVEEHLERGEDAKPIVSVRTIQAWSHGDREPKYVTAMAALKAVGLKEVTAYEMLISIHDEYHVPLKVVPLSPSKTLFEEFPYEEVRKSILTDKRITHLPAVFETGETLPLATTFVDLALIDHLPRFQPALLERIETPGERLRQRESRLRRPRQPAKHALDASTIQPKILIGGPGSGKSALMRRIALDVAEGQWMGATLPLFVELRRYWAVKSKDSSMTILDYALFQRLPRLSQARETREHLVSQIVHGRVDGIILLADGLDEISAMPDAVDTIYEELENLVGIIPWIASSRPTGLRRNCGEAKLLELEPMSIDSVEQLIKAWSVASKAPDWFPGKVFAEILARPGLRQMAENPFLLTALCYLRRTDLERPLPESRAALYQRLFDQIALQAQRRHNDTSILDAKAFRALEDFSRALYEKSDQPKQIFSLFDWQSYGPLNLNFERRILPARLITSLNEIDADYHFLHLTLQEHLIARSLLRSTPPNVAKLRFSPAWRTVIKAYAALLFQTGDQHKFRSIVVQLYEERDLLGMSYFHLAEIFADAGIKDTSPWILDDLREKLWSLHEEQWDELGSLARQALQSLDAEFLEIKGYLALQHLDKELDDLEEAYPEDFEQSVFPGEPYQQYGFDDSNAPRVLAAARTDGVHRKLRAVFFGKKQRMALAVSTAFADIARPSDRSELAEIGRNIQPDSEMAYRLFAYAIAAPSGILVPFLARFAQMARLERSLLWDRIIELMISIGGEDAVVSLADLLNQDIDEWEKHSVQARNKSELQDKLVTDWNNLLIMFSQFSNMGERERNLLLQLAESRSEDERFKNYLIGERLKLDGIPDEQILPLLDEMDSDMASAVLLSDAQDKGNAVSLPVRLRLISKFSEMTIDEKEQTAVIEAACIASGAPAIGVNVCIEEAVKLWAGYRQKPDLKQLPLLMSRLDGLLSPARLSRSRAALPLIHEILSENSIYAHSDDDDDLRQRFIVEMLNNMTHIFDGNGLPNGDAEIERFTKLLLNLMFADEFDVTYDVAISLGYINLQALLMIRGALNVDAVLGEISAELDVMIFEKFWAGPDGQIHQIVDKQSKFVCLPLDQRGAEASAVVSHYLVEHGIIRESSRPGSDASVVIQFSADPSNPDVEFSEVQKKVLATIQCEKERPIIYCDLLKAEADPKGIAYILAESVKRKISACEC